MRAGISYETYRTLTTSEPGMLLQALVSDSLVEPVVITPYGIDPPDEFVNASDLGLSGQGWMHWASYEESQDDRGPMMRVVTQIDGSQVTEKLPLDDAWYRHKVQHEMHQVIASEPLRAVLHGPAFECLVAKTLRCDLFITDMDSFVDLDGETGFLFPTEPMSVETAIPILGLFLRWNGQYRLDYRNRVGSQRNLSRPPTTGYDRVAFFQKASGALLPSLKGFSYLSDYLAEDLVEQFEGIMGTVAHRVEQVLRTRDQMLTLLAVAPTAIDSAYLIGDLLDQILLLALAAVDSITEGLAMLWGLPLKNASWSGSKFQTKVKSKLPALADVFEPETGGEDYRAWKIVSALRNAIHGQALTDLPHARVVGDFAGRTLFPLPRRRIENIREALDGHESLEDWGIFENVTAHVEAALHPGLFVETLVPRVIRLLETILTCSRSALPLPQNTAPRAVRWRPLSFDERASLRMLGLATTARPEI